MDRQRAHQLLEGLDPVQFTAVGHLFEVMAGHSLAESLNAPVEEEEITEETAAALDRSRASLKRGEGVPHEGILREFGLTK